jgi:hypothetical protein
MLTLLGAGHRYCDGVSWRSFLKIGGLAMGGLGLPELLQAEAQGGVGRSHKSVIMVYLTGGLAHQDTFDLKPEAPAEVRGEFRPIAPISQSEEPIDPGPAWSCLCRALRYRNVGELSSGEPGGRRGDGRC